jgi:hypothetical protein
LEEIHNKKLEIKQNEKTIKQNLNSEDLETVIVTDIRKLAMRNLFGYYDFLIKEMKFHLNPVDQEKLEMARFQIENNLPINKFLLYQVAPEFFEMELDELEERERQKVLSNKIRLVQVSRKGKTVSNIFERKNEF